LDVDERRSQEISRLLAKVRSTLNKMEQATGVDAGHCYPA
jgi:hypothetical protein